MSRTLQSNNLNLISIEGLVLDYTAALSGLKEDPFSGGYTLSLHTTLADLGISVALNEAEYLPKIKQYIEQLIVNLGNRFPHCRVLTLIGYFDPCNVSQATPAAIMELAECFHIDQVKFWSEYLVYRSLAGSLQPEAGQSAMQKVAGSAGP